ncbi:MAG: glycine zipper 2TM domain-containing protein [Halobacteria archaeon]|nr:glycine zipper 2TM domain-containing protein [Halobacteria archaeon]
MHTRILILAGAITLALGTTACTNEQTGQVVGGILGGVAGHQVGSGSGQDVATVVGAIAGTFIGGAVGRSMDDTDRLKAGQSLEYNRTHEPSHWQNPNTGNNYTMTPTRTYQTGNGQYCREYTTDVVVGGRRETAYGTACRQPDGSWKVVS